ncbi:hypothetical protein Hte_006604 [Hypoxylon texense]
MSAPVVNFITGNANKLLEVKAILEPAGIVVQNQKLDLPEIQGTLEDVTREKCRVAAALVGGPVLVEDTCLCFDALNGLPGPYMYVPMRPFYFPPSCTVGTVIEWVVVLDQKTARGPENYETFSGEHVWENELKPENRKWFMQSIGHAGLNNLLAAYDDKSAQAVATFGFSKGPGQEVLLFQGRTHGKIVPPRGPTTFGWDPIFEYEGQTYAEMEKVAKNKISHRFKALEKLRAWIEGGMK